MRLPSAAESLAMAAGRLRKPVLLVTGADVGGPVYGPLELTDQVQCAADPAAAHGTMPAAWSSSPSTRRGAWRSGAPGGRYSAADVSQWLEGFARGAREHLGQRGVDVLAEESRNSCDAPWPPGVY